MLTKAKVAEEPGSRGVVLLNSMLEVPGLPLGVEKVHPAAGVTELGTADISNAPGTQAYQKVPKATESPALFTVRE